MCRIDYAEGSGFWRQPLTERRANKDHTCGDCGRTIHRGERYTHGVWLETLEGPGYYTTKMCQQCVAAGRWLKKVCGGHFWPGVLEELEEHWEEEFELRSVGLGRLILLGKRRWQRDGQLIPVEHIRSWVDQALTRVPESSLHG